MHILFLYQMGEDSRLFRRRVSFEVKAGGNNGLFG